MCSFWYVEALTRAGRLEEARITFEKLLTYANHVGLYAEQIGQTGEQQGNFPQALTHLALISLRTASTARWVDIGRVLIDRIVVGHESVLGQIHAHNPEAAG